MAGFGHTRQSKALFSEDFDAPEAISDPGTIEPVLTASDLSEARAAAWHAGHAAGLMEAVESEAAATRRAVEEIAALLARENEMAAARAEQSAVEMTQLLLNALATTFPQLCKEYGDAEARAVVRLVIPALMQEPVITLHANHQTAAAAASEIARLDPDAAARLRISECDEMPQGDVRIAWRNGSATRDAALLWRQVIDVLMPMGLLGVDTVVKETINGD